MPIKSKCESCEFFKKHIFFGEKSPEDIGGTCLITNKTTKCICAGKIITFDLEQQCPLKKLNEYEKLRECWAKLRGYILNLERQSEKLSDDCQSLLLDIIIKISQLEAKGENNE